MRPRFVRTLAVGGAGIIALSTMIMIPPAHAASGAKLSVLHAVPGLTVDVYVDGKRTIDDFKPGSLAGPLSLPAGTYSVAITAGDAKDDSKPAIGPIDLTLKNGENYTAVAHLKANGDPTATLFTNDLSSMDAGMGRLTVRHTAAAPAVDVLAGGKAVVSDLSNPKEATLNLDAGTIKASVAAAGTTDPVIGPADVTVSDGALTIVYAWGSLEDTNLKLAVQTINGDGSSPGGVGAGEAGLVGTGGAAPLAALGLVLAALVALSIRMARPARATTGR